MKKTLILVLIFVQASPICSSTFVGPGIAFTRDNYYHADKKISLSFKIVTEKHLTNGFNVHYGVSFLKGCPLIHLGFSWEIH